MVLPVVAQLALPLEVPDVLHTFIGHGRRYIPVNAHRRHTGPEVSSLHPACIITVAKQVAGLSRLLHWCLEAHLAWTSMTTRAPHVVRWSLVRLPRTRLTSLASSWLHLQPHQHSSAQAQAHQCFSVYLMRHSQANQGPSEH